MLGNPWADVSAAQSFTVPRTVSRLCAPGSAGDVFKSSLTLESIIGLTITIFKEISKTTCSATMLESLLFETVRQREALRQAAVHRTRVRINASLSTSRILFSCEMFHGSLKLNQTSTANAGNANIHQYFPKRQFRLFQYWHEFENSQDILECLPTDSRSFYRCFHPSWNGQHCSLKETKQQRKDELKWKGKKSAPAKTHRSLSKFAWNEKKSVHR